MPRLPLLAPLLMAAALAALSPPARAAATAEEPVKLPFPAQLLKDLEAEDPSTRVSALQAIKPFTETVSFDILLRLAGKDPVPEVRSQAIGALWNRGDRRAGHALEIILNIDTDPGVRLAAAGALGRVGLKTSVPYLVSGMSKEKDPALISRCLRSIGELGDSASTPSVIPFLAETYPFQVRGTAAVALGLLGSDKSAQPLTSTLERDPQPSVRAQAAEALGRLRSPGTEDALVRALLFDNAPTVRHNAAEALSTFAHGEAVHDAFVRGIRDVDRRVRMMSLAGLATRSRQADVMDLADLLADESPLIRDMARDLLSKMSVKMEKVGERYRLLE